MPFLMDLRAISGERGQKVPDSLSLTALSGSGPISHIGETWGQADAAFFDISPGTGMTVRGVLIPVTAVYIRLFL